MDDLLLEPLKYYNERGKQKHHDNIQAYFDALTAESGIDVEAHRETVRQYHEQQETVKNLDKKISKYKMIRGLLIALAVLGGFFLIAGFTSHFLWIFPGVAAIVGAIFLIVKKINPPLKDFNAVLEKETEKERGLLAQAEAQMAPLNALFDNTDTFRLIEQTLPEFKFDMRYSTEREGEFYARYDFEDILTDESSMLNTISGSFKGNPFLYERYMLHEMGTEIYHGELEISWVEYYTDSDGNTRSERKRQTLRASVEKEKPYYLVKTLLCYGHQGCPDLTFTRSAKHTEQKSDKAIARMVKSGEKDLQKKARAAVKDGGTFTEMTNTEFDVLFGALDRDNEVQFRMMYTPLAQNNTVSLLKSKDGFGDDFDMLKQKRLNAIMSEHAQDLEMNTDAENYYSYNIDEAREKFFNFNETFFKAFFFDFAPLMSVPLYQESPTQSLEPIELPDYHYSYYEHEVMANAIDSEALVHEETATEAILKTRAMKMDDLGDCVEVTAYSYAAEERVDFVPVLGGDGDYHNVPVPWIEYIPLEKKTMMTVHAFDFSQRGLNEKIEEGFRIPIDTSSGCAYAHGLFAHAVGEEEDAEETVRGISGAFKDFH